MFGHRFFGARYYGPRYWGDGGTGVPPEPPVVEPDLRDTHDGGPIRRVPGRTFDRLRRKAEEIREALLAVYAEAAGEVATVPPQKVPAAIAELPRAETKRQRETVRKATNEAKRLLVQLREVESALDAARKQAADDEDDDAMTAFLVTVL